MGCKSAAWVREVRFWVVAGRLGREARERSGEVVVTESWIHA